MTRGPLMAVVFDLDGLMFNTEELYQDVGRALLQRRGADLTPELLDQIMGRPARDALRLMIDWHGIDATVEELAAETEDLFFPVLEKRLAPMPGLPELLHSLEANTRRKAIATSSGRRYASAVLGRFGWEPRFEFLLTGDDVTHGKPHPEIYQKAAAQLDLAPEQLLVLEDSQNGCRSAAAAGAFVVAVPSGHSHRHDFSTATLIANTLADRRIYDALGLE